MYLYFKENKLKMYSEELIDAPSFERVEMDLDDEELSKLKSNCLVTLNDSSLEFGEPTILTSAEEQARKTLVQDLKGEIEKITDKKTITKEDLLNIFNSIAA